MKPGSSHRCKSKKDDYWRCHLNHGHGGPHQAPVGTSTMRWETSQ